EDHRLRRVVDDQVDARVRLERADVPALPADYPALHVVRRKREDRDRGLGCLIRRDPLDRDRHDLPRSFLALFARLLLEVADRRHGLALRVVDDLHDEGLPRLLRGHVRHALEALAVLLRRVLQLHADRGEALPPGVELGAETLELRSAAFEGLLPLGDRSLAPLDLLAPGADLDPRLLAHP